MAAYERSDAIRLEETDPGALMRAWGTLTAEVAEQLTPVLLIVRAAAGHDASMATLLRDSDTERLERMRHNARFLAERGYLRDGVTIEHAADVMWTCSSAEIYELLVMRRGWSSEQFATFVAETMAVGSCRDVRAGRAGRQGRPSRPSGPVEPDVVEDDDPALVRAAECAEGAEVAVGELPVGQRVGLARAGPSR